MGNRGAFKTQDGKNGSHRQNMNLEELGCGKCNTETNSIAREGKTGSKTQRNAVVCLCV